MKKAIKAVVLAAGQSTRMKSAYSKVVHKILGKEIINYLLDNLVEAGVPEENIVIVAGANVNEIRGVVDRGVQYAIQDKQLGTGHALICAQDYLKGFDGDVMVVVGDNPYVNAVELKRLIKGHEETGADCTLLSAVFPGTPPPYGRIIRERDGAVTGIVEQLDATAEQLKIREVNASIYLFDNKYMFPLLFKIDNNNAKSEYYLTDIVKLLRQDGRNIDAVKTDDYYISIGINNRWELQEAQAKFNGENLKRLAVEEGVTIIQPETVTVELGVEIGKDTTIYPGTYIASGTRIGSNCIIGPSTYLENTVIPDNTTIRCEKKIGN